MQKASYQETEFWLRSAVRRAPRPLPPGMFPHIMQEALQAGFERTLINDVVDEWLSYGYCTITDPVDGDISLTQTGLDAFGRRVTLPATPED